MKFRTQKGHQLTNKHIKKIAIVGGGTAGWMSAAILSKYMPSDRTEIVLIESEEIGTIGVGEATIPHIANFNFMLGIDEATFIRETQATFKLGIEFVDWGCLGERYMHPFGEYGLEMSQLPFHHSWRRSKDLGINHPLEDYCLNIVAAKSGKFMRPVDDPTSLASRIPYAYHLDATLYAKFLRRFSEAHGAQRIEGKVVDVRLATETGHIERLQLESGRTIEADLFIDCTGFRGVLIEGALKAGYDDWSDLLPMDRAVAIQSQTTEPPKPYTIATARKAGWTWRIPLQHRVGNGHVYSSRFMDQDEAMQILQNSIEGDAITDPKHLYFKTGRRKTFWKGNCIALGLSSGFLEPLESTSIHLIQEGLVRLVAFLPDERFSPENIKEYNRVMGLTYERIRDFILLHYVVTERKDTEFWRYIQSLDVPEIMSHRMRLLRDSGHFAPYEYDLFKLDSWLAVMDGQGQSPQAYNAIAANIPPEELKGTLHQLRYAVSEIARQMPTHQQFIDRYAKAPQPVYAE